MVIVRKNLEERERVPFFPVGESLTKQSMKDECDMNVLLANYKKSGFVAHVNERRGDYSDLDLMCDYHTAFNKMLAARDVFMELPALLRKKFNNDAGEFVEFAVNPDNLEDMRDLGLAPVLDKIIPIDVNVIPPVEPVKPE